MSEQIDALSLEKAMEELETIAVKMEQGNVTMEQTMQLYERGTLLAKHCKDKLDGYQLRIRMLQDGEEQTLEL